MKARHVLGKCTVWLLLVMFLVTSCAAPIQQKDIYIHSNPRTQVVSNEYFDAELTPLLLNYNEAYSLGINVDYSYDFCVIFQLSLKNKSDKAVEIDWNRTLYISQGQTSGGFMFEGITYLTRNNPKPPDVVFAHSSILKRIFPNNLIDFDRRWVHYPMSPGENGVYLSVIVDGKEITEKLTVSISYGTREMVEDKERKESLEKQKKDFEKGMEDIKKDIEKLK